MLEAQPIADHLVPKRSPPRAPALVRYGVVGVCLLLCAAGVHAGCVKESPRHAVAVLELYTSEGCSSCPPADRWLSRISADGPGADSAVPLAFHVDYWDRLGWKDRFAAARFSERQYALARQAGSRAVYTPGVFLNFQELREDAARGELLQATALANGPT